MFNNIQILRAFAAINVVVFHSIGTAVVYGYYPEVISLLNVWGASGVDLFFVISGFIIHHTQVETPKTQFQFLIRRCIRIIPLYYILTITFFVLLFVLPESFLNSPGSQFERLIVSLTFLSQAVDSNSPLIHVGWTLEWEMLFYAIFALSLHPNGNLNVKNLIIFLIGTYVFTHNLIVFEFLLGVLVSIISKRNLLNKKYGSGLLLIGLILLGITIFTEPELQYRLLFWGFPSAIILFGVLNIRQSSNCSGVLLGNASYSIYLIQVFTIPGFYKFITKVEIKDSFGDLLLVLCVVITTVAGVIVYQFCEKPLISLIKNINKLKATKNNVT